MKYVIMGVSIADKAMKAVLCHKSGVKQRSCRLTVGLEQHPKRHRPSD